MDECLCGYDDSDGDILGNGNGYGEGCAGDGNGYGDGEGNGGSGDIFGNGDGFGDCDGYGYAAGTGFGSGLCEGYSTRAGNGSGSTDGYGVISLGFLEELGVPLQYHHLFPSTVEGILFANRFVNVGSTQEQESVLGILELTQDGIA
jgi:hypothetical protein